VAIIFTPYLAVVVILLGGGAQTDPAKLFFPVAFIIVMIVAGGSLYKVWQLSSGGEAVARMLGAKPVEPNTADPAERRLLNVVEEMAIASGTTVPRVFILEDPSINALAAGLGPSDAVVGVTRGALLYLSRDELQRDRVPRGVAAGHLAASAGALAFAYLKEARALLSSLPGPLVELAHEPTGARALALALLTSREGETRQQQLQALTETSIDLAQEVAQVSLSLDALGPEARLPLLELSVPALRRLSPPQGKDLLNLAEQLIAADQKLELFELVLRSLLIRQLDPDSAPLPSTAQFHSLVPVRAELTQVLSCLAHAGAEDAEKAREAFDAAARLLHPSARNRVHFLTREASDLAAFPAALERLRKLAPALKRSFVAAAAVSVSHDGQVSPSEAELFRAVAEVLDVPAPGVTEETPVG
jgi:uncharacterized tellurite resistance protein B-like protein